MQQKIADFLSKGGHVTEVPSGISGRESTKEPLKPDSIAFHEPKTERTYVPEVVATLEARKTKKAPEKPRSKRPKKKLIYDDFGEPLRWEWVD